jgi:hypothetical protein
LLCGASHEQFWIVYHNYYRNLRLHLLDLTCDESSLGTIVVKIDYDGVKRFAIKLFDAFVPTTRA